MAKKPTYLDHLALTVKDVARTERFYRAFLGPPLQRDDCSVAWRIGRTRLFFGLAYRRMRGNTFSSDRIGLNHIAFGVRTVAHLRALQRRLATSGIANSGVRIDRHGKRPYVWFDDPDGIRVEFYQRDGRE